MSVRFTLSATPIARELLTVGVDGASRPELTYSEFKKEISLDNATTPPVSKVVGRTLALSSGAATVDLTTITGANGATVNSTGSRVQAIYLENVAANSNTIAVTQGASNGYDGFGPDFKVTLNPGAMLLIYSADGGTDIGASNRTLDLAGTGAQTFNLLVVTG
jgi:hypothetical protein